MIWDGIDFMLALQMGEAFLCSSHGEEIKDKLCRVCESLRW